MSAHPVKTPGKVRQSGASLFGITAAVCLAFFTQDSWSQIGQRAYVIVSSDPMQAADIEDAAVMGEGVRRLNEPTLQLGGNRVLDVPLNNADEVIAELRERFPRAHLVSMQSYANFLEAVPDTDLDADLRARVQALRALHGGRDVRVVRTPPAAYGQLLLRSAEDGALDQALTVEGPQRFSFTDVNLAAVRLGQRLEALSASGDTLAGVISNMPVDNHLAMGGTLYAEGDEYRIESLDGGGLHLLIATPDTSAWADHPRSNEDGGDGFDLGAGTDEDGEEFDAAFRFPERCNQFDDHVVRIGWFADGPTYADLLSGRPTGVPALLADAIRDMNNMLVLHGVNGPNRTPAYRFELVALLNRPFRPNQGHSLTSDSEWLASGERSEYDAVWSEARKADADLVVQVVSYAAQSGLHADAWVCGHAPNRKSLRAIIVDIACLGQRRSALQHEIGHKFGAGHDHECCRGGRCAGSPAYRYDWREPNQRVGTLMVTWQCPRVTQALISRYHHYSDPSLQGRGDAASRHVGQLIRDRIDSVAGFHGCGIH